MSFFFFGKIFFIVVMVSVMALVMCSLAWVDNHYLCILKHASIACVLCNSKYNLAFLKGNK